MTATSGRVVPHYATAEVQAEARRALEYVDQCIAAEVRDPGVSPDCPREIWAVRRLREQTGMGLLDAKDAVWTALGWPVRDRQAARYEAKVKMVGALRGLAHDLTEHPGSWPEELLAQVVSLSRRVAEVSAARVGPGSSN